MVNAGIDYGMGRTNVDHATGIRYGVISQHSVSQAWCDSAEPQYPEPSEDDYEQAAKKHGWTRSVHNADLFVDSDGNYEQADSWQGLCVLDGIELDDYLDGAEPNGWTYDAEGYQLVDCLDSDIMVLKSPFYTFGPYCSPCVPGAVNLDDAREDGAKAYCFGHDWFEGGKAPYPVYSVADDSLVVADVDIAAAEARAASQE